MLNSNTIQQSEELRHVIINTTKRLSPPIQPPHSILSTNIKFSRWMLLRRQIKSNYCSDATNMYIDIITDWCMFRELLQMQSWFVFTDSSSNLHVTWVHLNGPSSGSERRWWGISSRSGKSSQRNKCAGLSVSIFSTPTYVSLNRLPSSGGAHQRATSSVCIQTHNVLLHSKSFRMSRFKVRRWTKSKDSNTLCL